MVDFNLLPPCTIFTQRKVQSLLPYQDARTVIHCIRLHSNPKNIVQRIGLILCKIWEAIKSFFGYSYHQRSQEILKTYLYKFSPDLSILAPETATLLAKQWITRLIDLNDDPKKEYSEGQLDTLVNQAFIQKERAEKEFNKSMNLFPDDEIEQVKKQVKISTSPKKKLRTRVKTKENNESSDNQFNFKEVESEGSDEEKNINKIKSKRKSQKEEDEDFDKSFNHILNNLDEKKN